LCLQCEPRGPIRYELCDTRAALNSQRELDRAEVGGSGGQEFPAQGILQGRIPAKKVFIARPGIEQLILALTALRANPKF